MTTLMFGLIVPPMIEKETVMRFFDTVRWVVLACGVAACGVMTSAMAAEDDHPTEGPHHGTLIELGKEDFHAELVHDDATDTITIYILDAAAKKAVPIVAKKLTLNMVAAGKPQQFHLAAKPQEGDPNGLSSAFAATDKTLCQVLDAEDTKGRVIVEIGGKVDVGEVGGHGDHEKEQHN